MSQTDDPDLAREVAALRSEIALLNRHRFVRVQNSLWRLFAYRFAIGLFRVWGRLSAPPSWCRWPSTGFRTSNGYR